MLHQASVWSGLAVTHLDFAIIADQSLDAPTCQMLLLGAAMSQHTVKNLVLLPLLL